MLVESERRVARVRPAHAVGGVGVGGADRALHDVLPGFALTTAHPERAAVEAVDRFFRTPAIVRHEQDQRVVELARGF